MNKNVQLACMGKTYWNKQGKYQDFIEELDTPAFGYTKNKYLNALIAILNVYNDIYNNGGCNIKDSYMIDIKNYLDSILKINKSKLNTNNLEYIEEYTNKLIDLCRNEDLSYEKIYVYYDTNKKLLSKADNSLIHSISFGLEKDYSIWYNDALHLGYKEI